VSGERHVMYIPLHWLGGRTGVRVVWVRKTGGLELIDAGDGRVLARFETTTTRQEDSKERIGVLTVFGGLEGMLEERWVELVIVSGCSVFEKGERKKNGGRKGKKRGGAVGGSGF